MPGGLLARRYGTKLVFGLGNLLTALLGFLVPYVTDLYTLIILRMLQGLIAVGYVLVKIRKQINWFLKVCWYIPIYTHITNIYFYFRVLYGPRCTIWRRNGFRQTKEADSLALILVKSCRLFSLYKARYGRKQELILNFKLIFRKFRGSCSHLPPVCSCHQFPRLGCIFPCDIFVRCNMVSASRIAIILNLRWEMLFGCFHFVS